MSAPGAAGPGELAIVLHTHMPYVEGFGLWPFGEEWLWEALATSYLPLLDVLDAAPGGRSPVTLSITPVLADQLEAPGIAERFDAFARDLRRRSHELDAATAEAAGDAVAANELRRALGAYERAADRFAARGGDLVSAFAPHVSWTSAATHPVLPLLATDAGVRLQLETGIAAHRARFGGWGGGLWLPECAHAPWLDPLLEQAGVHAVCVELTDVLGADEQLRPLRTAAGPRLVPIDRAVIDLVWGADGYPAAPAYRDSHRLTGCHHKPWSNDGAVYDPGRAAEQVRADAVDFVGRVRERLAGGGLSVCALDTELLGHWWHEGVDWLAAVLEEALRAGLPIARLDEALTRHEPVAASADLPVTTWGTPRTLWTWDGPRVAGIAWAQRRAELEVVAAGAAAGDRALRELLAMQSSDWAFMVSRELAEPYARERVEGHAAGLRAALDAGGVGEAGVRSLAPHLARTALLEP
ncbi:1,4-alpha-glucan branching protein domain-containing protein [Capillimicrobium parvum]|uniref:1,4-alpha-glucan branching enzyme n=1 Tax=Capillimicrobium parvum TaxID=2884022 RepID=A0A9E7BZX2_9ACTN|nr:1,4-alpha-glucan branching protein domain-containing protein [Capillimicrobium parvum]UGS35024.1 1,4-alpha-glucan branching enzyme [Capillimicrobium parvum]